MSQKNQFLKGLFFGCFIGIVLLGIVFFVIGPEVMGLNYSYAQTPEEDLEKLRREAGYRQVDLIIVIGEIIRVFLGLLGVIAVALIIYGGIIWMTAGGSDDKILKAKTILRNAIIGLVIILAAFAIVSFIFGRLKGKLIEEQPGEGAIIHHEYPNGFKRGFAVTSVIPKEGAINVYRNTQIIANFNAPVLATSVKPETVIVKKTLTKEIVAGTLTVANNSFKFRPNTPCEEKPTCFCFEANTHYTVTIKSGFEGVTSMEGHVLREDKVWSFSTGDLIDLERPYVKSFWPITPPDAPRNTKIQVVFSKKIDPTTVNSTTVKIEQDGKKAEGTFTYGDDSFSFRPNTPCPAPHENLFCFEGEKEFKVILSEEIMDYTGCNKLDCANGKCSWTFRTSNEIDTIPPYVLENSLKPKRNEKNVDRGINIQATFSEPMDITSINNYTIELIDQGATSIKAKKINLSGDFKTFTFNPGVILNPKAIYAVYIYGGEYGVKDASGIPMEKDFSWGFKTDKEAFGGNPYIDFLDPNSGPEGTCLTVRGINFSSSGELLFKNKAGNFVKAEEIGFWQDKFITGVVPNGLGFNKGEKSKIKVKIGEKESNEVDFTITDSPLGACLLKMSPLSGAWKTPVILEGKRFGKTRETNDGVIFYETPATDFVSWSETKIETKVPEAADDGRVRVVKGGKNSNGIYFDVANKPGEKCDFNSQCQPPSSNCCENNLCKENCEIGGTCLENKDCLSNCCLDNLCRLANECPKKSCDKDVATPGCQSDSNLCEKEEKCDSEGGCVCRPEHCFNGRKDADEEGVDCGGRNCRSCLVFQSCRKNADCNPSLIRVPGLVWDGTFEEDLKNWRMGGQINSRAFIESEEGYGGTKVIRIQQDANQDYPGQCNEKTCNNLNRPGSWIPCTWISGISGKGQCKFNSGDECKGWDDPTKFYYNEGETLCWGNTNRVMWTSLTYNTVPLKLEPGKTYTYSFWYKGHSAGGLSMRLTFSIGWGSQCVPKDWYGGHFCKPTKRNPTWGECPAQPTHCCINLPYQRKCYPQIWLGSVPAGNYPEWRKYTKTFVYTEEMSKTFDSKGNLRNEIGMSMGYNSTGSLGTDLYIDNIQLEEGDTSSDLICCEGKCLEVDQCRFTIPKIESISPTDGMVKDPVTTYVSIRGRNFGKKQGRSKVYFGDKEASLTCQKWSDTEIVTAVPFGLSGKVPVKVVTERESNQVFFTVNEIIRPSICVLSPNHGKTGDKITIEGTNFGDFQINNGHKSQVLFEDIETEVISWSNNKIVTVVPKGIKVNKPKIKVILKWKEAPAGTESNEVTFYMEPYITSIEPNKGPVGTYVTIRGGNFGDELGEVFFNGVKADIPPCRFEGLWIDTQIVTIAPDSTTGLVVVEVPLPNGETIKSNGKTFTYNNDPLAPGICLDKTKGAVTDPVKIQGNKLGETALEGESVTFNQSEARVSLENPDHWSNHQIDTEVPETTSGDVLVTKVGERDTGKKRCVGGIYVLGTCVGGKEEPIIEKIILKSNPVWFEVTEKEIIQMCGNNKREGTEICDGSDLDGKTCSDFNLQGEGLKCHSDCLRFDTTQCKGPSGVCGDGVINPGETCDKNNLANKKCTDFDDYTSGDLSCTKNCELDFSNCKISLLPVEPPTVFDYAPKGISVCRNAVISVTFDQLMDEKTFRNKDTIIISKNQEKLEGRISAYDEDIDNDNKLDRTVATFTPNENLGPQSEYKVLIKGGEEGVKSRAGKGMENNKEWSFKTGSILCKIDKVEINPSAWTFFTSETEQSFTAVAKDKYGTLLQASYFWRIEDPASIVNLVTGPAQPQIAEVEAKNKNGRTILHVQADAYGGTKEAQANIEVFLCENPWFYEDKLTNFKTFYCRDR